MIIKKIATIKLKEMYIILKMFVFYMVMDLLIFVIPFAVIVFLFGSALFFASKIFKVQKVGYWNYISVSLLVTIITGLLSLPIFSGLFGAS